jgi:HEPN domain-containing protein
MKPHLEEAWRAIRLADRDIHAFHVLKEDAEVHLSVMCFHAQQAVEKLLKAVLFAHQIEFRRTHDLAELSYLLSQNGLVVPLDEVQLLRLNPFAVTYRYDDLDITTLTAPEASQWVDRVRVWADSEVFRVEKGR